jgi:mutual gliding-motility protein MglA
MLPLPSRVQHGMVFFNYSTMQMAAKVVYYGPGLCGKTTNLHYIYGHTSGDSRGEMVSLETETDRTLFFDLLPIDVGQIAGFNTRIQLYTVPGQVFYNTTRKLVLKGVDGVVFVADSQRAMVQANIDSFKNLEENLAEMGLSSESLPLVLQYNKRDLANICTVEEMNRSLNPHNTLRVLGSHRPGGLRNAQGGLEAHPPVAQEAADPGRRGLVLPQPPGAAPARGRPGDKPGGSPGGGCTAPGPAAALAAGVTRPGSGHGPGGRQDRGTRGAHGAHRGAAADLGTQPLGRRPGRARKAAAGGHAADLHAGSPARRNGRGELSRNIELTLKRADFERARRILVSFQVEDDQNRIMDSVRDLPVEIKDAASLEKLLLRLNIALNAKE